MPRTDSDLAAQVHGALERGELHLVYQPEYDLRTRAIVGVEALLRWDHPVLGVLGPDEFVPTVERSPLIDELGRWVIATAAAQYAGWRTSDVVLRVNVSSVQMSGDEIVDVFDAVLRRHGLRGAQLCAEITETALMTDPRETQASVRRLRALGVQVALDDLGDGYSSLHRLRQLPVDVVKIDRSLVSGIDTDERAVVIVSAVLAMARRLGADVVAEGVENAREAAVLLELGCHRAQGHHLGRPAPAHEIAALLGATTRTEPRRPRPFPARVSAVSP